MITWIVLVWGYVPPASVFKLGVTPSSASGVSAQALPHDECQRRGAERSRHARDRVGRFLVCGRDQDTVPLEGRVHGFAEERRDVAEGRGIGVAGRPENQSESSTIGPPGQLARVGVDDGLRRHRLGAAVRRGEDQRGPRVCDRGQDLPGLGRARRLGAEPHVHGGGDHAHLRAPASDIGQDDDLSGRDLLSIRLRQQHDDPAGSARSPDSDRLGQEGGRSKDDEAQDEAGQRR